MLIAWRNLTDAAMLEAGSEIDTLPATNVQQAHVARKWHTVAGVKSSYVLFDLGAAAEIDLLTVLGSNMTPAGTVRVRASTSDPTAVSGDLRDTTAIAAGVKAGYGAVYKQFTAATARYWRVDLADSAVADNLQTGRIVLWRSWEPTVNEQLGASQAVRDPSQRAQSWGGQVWADRRPKQRVRTFTLDFMEEAEMFSNAFALAWENGITEDVVVIPDISSAYLSEQAIFGQLDDDALEINNHELAIYRTRYTVKERL